MTLNIIVNHCILMCMYMYMYMYSYGNWLGKFTYSSSLVVATGFGWLSGVSLLAITCSTIIIVY